MGDCQVGEGPSDETVLAVSAAGGCQQEVEGGRYRSVAIEAPGRHPVLQEQSF